MSNVTNMFYVLHMIISVTIIVLVMCQTKNQIYSNPSNSNFYKSNKILTPDIFLRRFTSFIAIAFILSSVTVVKATQNESKKENKIYSQEQSEQEYKEEEQNALEQISEQVEEKSNDQQKEK